MNNVYEKLEEMGLKLPKAPEKGGAYAPVKPFGENLIYVSGCGPVIDISIKGKLGKEFSKEEGYLFSRDAMLNILALVEAYVGDLNKVSQPIKVLTLVASDAEFYDQPYVANGGTQLLIDLFGKEKGAPSRSAIGVPVLPGNIPVETEAIFEIKAV